jgi:hypothetical protein
MAARSDKMDGCACGQPITLTNLVIDEFAMAFFGCFTSNISKRLSLIWLCGTKPRKRPKRTIKPPLL